MFPEFLCIGAEKAGTTWLYEMLKAHPSVWMPPIKEIHYFDMVPSIPFTSETTDQNVSNHSPPKHRLKNKGSMGELRIGFEGL